MAWTTPRTFVTGELETSSIFNTHLRDNLLAINSIPAARVNRTTNLSAGSGAGTAVSFDAERYDTDTIHDLSSNTDRLTCKTAGKYLISGHIAFAANATGYREVYIELNGATVIAATQVGNAGGADETRLSVTTLYQLALNDYVRLVGVQNSGVALNIVASAQYSAEFAMQRLSD